MDSSFHLADELDSEEHYLKTEMKFEQGGVSQKFTVNDRRRREILIPGKLMITENRHGRYIEWKPVDHEPGSSPRSRSYSSTYSDNKAWAMVDESSKIGFKPGLDEEAIQFVVDPREEDFRRPLKLEFTEIRSILIPSKSRQHELIFILQDGTSVNPFIFERTSVTNLIAAMKYHVNVIPSKDNKDLFLVTPLKTPMSTSQTGVPELYQLFPENVQGIFSVIRDVRNDPMAVAKTGLAKLADYTATQLNGYVEQQRANSKSTTPRSTTPLSPNHGNEFRRPESSPHSNDGLDADYTTNEEGYEVIFKPEKLSFDLGKRSKTYRGQPLNQEQWLNYLDNDGRVVNMEEIKSIIFRGGIEPAVRKHVWVFLLRIYPSNSTYEERKEMYTDMTSSYDRMKLQWSTMTDGQEERFHLYRDFKSLIEKDVARTDRTLTFFSGDNNPWSEILRRILITYVMYNFNVGYVQGMSDILSPILMEVEDEVLAFWLFVKFMERIYQNFEMSQETMQRQLKESYTLLQLVHPKFSAYLNACDADNMYFAFRWLLILFKREFSTSDIMTLWEVLWTDLPGPNFHLFIGLAILEQHQSTIMELKFGLSEILRHINDLSMKIDLSETLCIAESIYLQLLGAQDKLPNNIRSILCLPLKEEEPTNVATSLNSTLLGSDSSSTTDEPVITVNGCREGEDLNTGNGVLLSESILQQPSRSPTVEEQSLELNCELGISQFM